MKASIKIKLIVSYVVLSLFLISSVLIASDHMFRKHFETYIRSVQEQKNVAVVNQVLDEFVKDGVPNPVSLYTLGQSALDNGIILMVYDKFGTELFCMSKLENVESENMLEAMKETMVNRFPDWQGEYREVIYGLTRGGINYGKVTLGYYGPFYYTGADIHFMDMLNSIVRRIGMVFSLVAVAIGYGMAARIAKPLKEVTEKAGQIEAGDFSERIDTVTGTRELDSLIASVNRLATTLEAEQAAKKRMANDYAHEFKTPLTTLQSNLEGMIDGILESSPERLESCRVEILRLSRMISEIDKIAVLEKSPMVLKKEVFDLKILLEHLAVNFDGELSAKALHLELDLQSVLLSADWDKISQVFVNLISNAIKYTDQGGQIRVTLGEREGFAELTVGDTGIGIAAEDLPYVFDNLYRADKSRARKTGGSGIGLSVVQAVVVAHGGTVEVRSAPGSGSTFTVRLPIGDIRPRVRYII